MRFTRLSIRNFRAIRELDLEDLSDLIVIAGANGSGKSCIFDALRLLKSAYGGYQADEVNQWLSEFQINLTDPSTRKPLFRNSEKTVVIEASVQLSADEKQYLATAAEAVIEPLVWSEVTGQSLDQIGYSPIPIATQYQEHGERVRADVAARSKALRASLDLDEHHMQIYIPLTGPIQVVENPTMQVVFRTYDPANLGVVDYHSANRNYAREGVGGITLDTRSFDVQRRQNSLYNAAGKYTNVKTELAASYVRDLIREKANDQTASAQSMNDTLRELFRTFFPDKEYLGVQPMADGSLGFPVKLSTGQVHDINELSSGEKEIVYGYLRLRNSAPKNSTLLLDEPELHLNPALLRGFPDFYHRNLGLALGNQIWLVTHSDTLLRQAVGNRSFSVFHLSPATSAETGNQARHIVVDDELERATMDLVGDLATYRPRSKVVIFEGAEDVAFDVSMVERLFPEFARRVNLISAGNKRSAKGLYDLLAATGQAIGVADRFFAIVDRDRDEASVPLAGTRKFSWDCYHIENYLLRPREVRLAVEVLTSTDPFGSDDAVTEALRQSAAKLLPTMVMESLRDAVNTRLLHSIDLGSGSVGPDPVAALIPSVQGSLSRIKSVLEEVLKDQWLRTAGAETERRLNAWLEDGSWVKEFAGRPVLQQFCSEHLGGKKQYQFLRNVILDRMVSEGTQPDGMRTVIDMVLDS